MIERDTKFVHLYPEPGLRYLRKEKEQNKPLNPPLPPNFSCSCSLWATTSIPSPILSPSPVGEAHLKGKQSYWFQQPSNSTLKCFFTAWKSWATLKPSKKLWHQSPSCSGKAVSLSFTVLVVSYLISEPSFPVLQRVQHRGLTSKTKQM